MKRHFKIRFWESYLPTSRHRIPHWRECTEIVAVEIPKLSLAEAPVAIRQIEPRDRLRSYPNRRLDYHYHGGELYTRIRLSRFISLNGKPDRFATVRDIYFSQPYRHHQGRDEALAVLHSRMNGYRIINGHLCARIGEPRYVVMTFGLGHNHGGTALMVNHSFNPNILTERYYRIDQECEAKAAALAIAKRRGDTKALPGLRQRYYDRFEVRIPEAVRMVREDHGPDDEFSQRIARITDSGMPPVVGALALALVMTR